MVSELVVDVQSKEVSIALVEDGNLVELQREGLGESFSVGNIYVGKVKKIMPGLNAAFVDVGYEKDAFIHYLDLGLTFNSINKYFRQVVSDRKKLPSLSKFQLQPDVEKEGVIGDFLKQGQELLVQIVKEPISSKGPRLTTEISFAGRYLVLIPFMDKVSVSQKIKSSEERARLKQLIQSIKPKNFGVIVRTVAEDRRVAELDSELRMLVAQWEDCLAKVQNGKLPSLVFEESSRTVAILRDLFNPSFQHIHINNKTVFEQVSEYVRFIAPDRNDVVRLYDKDIPIFDTFGITKQIKSSFGKTVSFRNGAYLVIEHTEAMHVVDVNSGNRSNSKMGQDENALTVNLNAATEIARQLRLRDMGGIIVVDFIDMESVEFRQKVYEQLRQAMSLDRAKHNILPLSKFGLMQITRQRVRPVLNINTTEDCPNCYGKGHVEATILFCDKIERKVDYLVNKLKVKFFILHVHPFVAAYLEKGLFSLKWRWRLQYSFFFRLVPNQNLAFLEYKFLDKFRNEIDLKEEIEIK